MSSGIVSISFKDNKVLCITTDAVKSVPYVVQQLSEKTFINGIYVLKMPQCTQDEFLAVLSKTYKGSVSLEYYKTLVDFGMISLKEIKDKLLAIYPSIDIFKTIRGFHFTGALSNGLYGAMDKQIENFMGGKKYKAGAVFFFDDNTLDGLYSSETLTVNADPKYTGEEIVCSFTLLLIGNIVHTFVLKILLNPRDDGKCWNPDTPDILFKKITVVLPGGYNESLSLSLNNILAKSKKLWPSISNTPPQDPKLPWLITIPIMLPMTDADTYKKSYLPIFPDTNVFLCGLNPEIYKKSLVSQISLDADYVHLEVLKNIKKEVDIQKFRNEKYVKYTPSEYTIVTKYEDDYYPIYELSNHGEQQEFHYRLHFPTSGIIITLEMDKSILKDFTLPEVICPVLFVRLLTDNFYVTSGDYEDLTEFNWLKVGLVPPKDKRTLLLPFSREMFLTDKESGVMPCTLNFSKSDKVTLCILPNKEVSWLRWKMKITPVCQNIRIFSTEKKQFCQKYLP